MGHHDTRHVHNEDLIESYPSIVRQRVLIVSAGIAYIPSILTCESSQLSDEMNAELAFNQPKFFAGLW